MFLLLTYSFAHTHQWRKAITQGAGSTIWAFWGIFSFFLKDISTSGLEEPEIELPTLRLCAVMGQPILPPKQQPSPGQRLCSKSLILTLYHSITWLFVCVCVYPSGTLQRALPVLSGMSCSKISSLVDSCVQAPHPLWGCQTHPHINTQTQSRGRRAMGTGSR